MWVSHCLFVSSIVNVSVRLFDNYFLVSSRVSSNRRDDKADNRSAPCTVDVYLSSSRLQYSSWRTPVKKNFITYELANKMCHLYWDIKSRKANPNKHLYAHYTCYRVSIFRACFLIEFSKLHFTFNLCKWNVFSSSQLYNFI